MKNKFILFISFVFILVNCKKDNLSIGITTNTVSSITETSAKSGGAIVNGSGKDILSKGIVWNTSSSPEITLSTKTSLSKNADDFESSMTNLSPNTTYFVRAYIEDSKGVVYGNEQRFNTVPSTQYNDLALDFDGVNDYVAIPDKDALDLTNVYTMEAWIKIDNFSYLAGIISKYQSPSAYGYMLRLSSSSPYNEINFDGMETSGLNLVANKWYHIAAVNNNGSRTLYVDGVLMALTGSADFYTANSNDDTLKFGSDYNSRFFNGKLDEVRLWKVARTSTQINAAKNNTLTGNESGLAAYYPFKSINANANSSNSGITQLLDFSSSKSNGELKNFALSSSSSNWISNVTFPVTLSVKLGDSYGGGVIVYLDASGQHGLVSATTDQSSGAWSTSTGSTTSVSTSTAYGTGKSNTNNMVSAFGSSSSYAAKTCQDLVLGGYDDWYLPSNEELNYVYTNRNYVGASGFSTSNAYWTSSSPSSSSSYGYGVSFFTDATAGKTYIYYKTDSKKVRAVRSF